MQQATKADFFIIHSANRPSLVYISIGRDCNRSPGGTLDGISIRYLGRHNTLSIRTIYRSG